MGLFIFCFNTIYFSLLFRVQYNFIRLLSKNIYSGEAARRTAPYAFLRNTELAIIAVARNYFCKAHTLFTSATRRAEFDKINMPGMHCGAANCNNYKKDNLSFFRFPRDKIRFVSCLLYSLT